MRRGGELEHCPSLSDDFQGLFFVFHFSEFFFVELRNVKCLIFDIW